MNIQSEIRKGSYFDSVVLMQLQRALLHLPGVLDAGVVMATAANCTLLQQSGLLTARTLGEQAALHAAAAKRPAHRECGRCGS